MSEKPISAKPNFYACCFYELKQIAHSFGYNLVLHGSINRDFDLIAIPWQEVVKPHLEMIEAFVEFTGGHILPETDESRQAFADKYHGRLNYVINLNRGGKKTNYEDPQWYIDISVIPLNLNHGNSKTAIR